MGRPLSRKWRRADPVERIGTASAETIYCPADVPALRAILVDGPPKARQAAADKLSLLANAAAPAVDDLIALATNPDPALRTPGLAPALQTLAKMDLAKIITQRTREELEVRMKQRTEDTDSDIARFATAVLKQLKE